MYISSEADFGRLTRVDSLPERCFALFAVKMETVLGAPIHNVPPLRRMSTPKRTSFRARTVCCSGSGAHDDIDMHHQDHLPSINNKLKEKHNDIWKLFREAQENILYLNKQRLLAMEELEKLKRENNSLLQRQLQSKKLNDTRTDKLWICSGLLLRIDSMVLAGMIDSSEASDLRRLIIDHKVSVADDFNDIMEKNDAVLLEELRQFSEISQRKGFHVIHICTEMAPVLCVGSLASYVTGLCCALQRKRNLVEVILPMYASLNLDEVHGLREVEAEFYSYFNGQLHRNKIWTGVVYGIGVTFIQPLDHSSFFSCEKVYGYSNDFERFTYFSRASLDYIVKSGKQPDILHIHNWETSIIGPLFWDVFVNQGLGGTRILLTCQNFESQCLEQPEKLALCGLDPSRLHRSDRLQDNNKAHLVNILKGGIVYSNKVLIMSSILPKGHIIHTMGHGLESTLTIHKDKLLIAPHGIDDSTWDPSQDRSLPQSYNADDMKGKSVCKVSLQQHLGLSENSSMIVVGCIVSDLSNVELENLRALVWMASRWSVQFIFMMFNRSPVISRACQSLQQEVEGENVRFVNNYDDVLAHLLIAGSDIMLCLSYDDPVLQLPLKAMKYGAAPLAIHLADSRFSLVMWDKHFVDHDFESTKLSQYINNTFANMSLSVAIDEIKNNPSQWNRRIKDAMTKNFSWEAECCDIHLSAYTAIKNL